VVCQTCRAIRRPTYLLLTTLAMMVCSGGPAVARVAAGDASATRAYLKAKIVLQRMTAADEPTELKAITALETQVKAECPNVLAGAPPDVKGEKANQSGFDVTEELLSVVFGAGGPVEHPADARFARTVRRLHWSNPKLTRLLHSLAMEQAEQSAIPPPELCPDLKFWVASGYTTTSAGTKAFLHRLSVVSSITQIESEPHEPASDLLNPQALVAHRLRRYEDRDDRLLARKAFPAEAKITDPALRPFLEAMGKVYAALGRSPAPAA
jgi:hypothetical protein